MPRGRSGFTLIELLIVVVIIGILAAIAIPKFAATKDKAKVASLKADIHNAEVAEEAYFSDHQTYGNLNQLEKKTNFSLSQGNTMTISGNAKGYIVTVTNTSISSGINSCTVKVGRNAKASVDGVIACS